jgi:hypothetical protein
MNDEFENALAWFHSAPSGWIESGKKNLVACAEWIWEVLQGDFNENASTAQVATGTVISMIPFVDQICDIRDLVANCTKIDDEPENSWHWVSLVLTLIGLFPALGSLVKGCLKVMFAGMRKAGAVSGATPRLALQLDQSVAQLSKFLDRPEVVKAVKALKWDNPYKILAAQLREIAAKLNVGALRGAFNDASKAAESMLGLVSKWGGARLKTKAGKLVETIANVRRGADRKVAEAIKPVQNYLKQLARRLEIAADMAHRAHLNAVNPHAFVRVSESEAVTAFKKAKPGWVDETSVIAHPRLDEAPTALPGWPNTGAYATFHTMKGMTIPPGTKLYRVVDPTSRDNSICWMSEEEFKKLKSKDDWRRRLAVWAHWNSNGEYITYTVPPGAGLNVWEGVTASQKIDGTDYVLEGGARQIVLDPAHLEQSYLSPRKKTRWGYDDLGVQNSLVGVPVQKNNWDSK